MRMSTNKGISSPLTHQVTTQQSVQEGLLNTELLSAFATLTEFL